MKRCRYSACRQPFVPRFRTTETTCSNEHARLHALELPQRKREKQAAQLANAERGLRREALRSLMTVKELYVRIAQPAVNAFVRLRDRHKGCISCTSGRVDDAGHFFPIGSKWQCHPLRLDVRLIHGQCRKCNSYVGGGNLHGYIAGLEARYGKAYVEECYAIKAAAERGEIPLLTREEIIAKGAEFSRMARELRKAA